MGNNGAIQPIKLGGAIIYGNVDAKPVRDNQGRIRFKVTDKTSGTEIVYPQQKSTNSTVINFATEYGKVYVTNMAKGDLVVGENGMNVAMQGCSRCTVDTSQNGTTEDNVDFFNSESFSSKNNKIILGDNDTGNFNTQMTSGNKFLRWFTPNKRIAEGKGTYNESDFYGFRVDLDLGNPFEKQSWR